MKVEELSLEECWKVLVKKRMGRLACSLNNQPYIVPLNFVYDGNKDLYAFSTVGQKIRWMRKNPLVCIELDEMKELDDWTTIIISGRYEELPDLPEFEESRTYAHELLSKYPMWWESVPVFGHYRKQPLENPLYFRIHIETISGLRTVSEDQYDYIETNPTLINPQKSRFWGLL